MWTADRGLVRRCSPATTLCSLVGTPSSDTTAGARRVVTDVMLTPVFALVSFVAVDITADDASEPSDIHEGRLDRGGSNGVTTMLSFMGEMSRSGIAWES